MAKDKDHDRTGPCPRGGNHDWQYETWEDDKKVYLKTTCSKCRTSSTTSTRK